MHRTLLASCLLALPVSLSAQATQGYLVDSNLDQLFLVDVATGAATFIASTANNGLATPADLAWHAATQQLWTIDLAGGEVGTIDTTTGTFTPVYQTGLNGWQGMAWDGGTQKFYLANQSGQNYVLDPATGLTTTLGASIPSLITALDIDNAGTLYGIDFSTGAVLSIDKTTGVRTQLSTTRGGIQGLGIDQVTGVWYGADTNTDSLYIIDPLTGANTLVGAHGAGVQFAKGFDLIDAGVGNYATKVRFGTGCYQRFASFYESGPFDLSNTSLQFINTGSGYLAVPTASTWYTPTSSPVTMGDDQVLPFTLNWTLPYPGGTTGTLYVSSNGFVNGATNALNGCCSFSIAQFLTAGPCWSALWHDLNPGAGGTVHFDTDPVTQTAYVTFTNVPQYGTSNLNTFQYAFSAAGIVELRWQSCAVTAAGVGWSPGLNNLNPGSIDISATPIIVTSLTDAAPLSLDGSARPVLGTNVAMNLTNIPATTPIAAVIYGLTKFDPGQPLAGIGMPGCFRFCSPDASVLLIAPGTSASSVFAIPNNPIFAGVHVIVQGAAYDPAGNHNQLGALSSNGVDLGLDLN
ncbi:MAG: hypothetical protein FJ265_11015 [Planctomycetes bacterium]|nr:hypothetical protein [Planctomycetota bacterium]